MPRGERADVKTITNNKFPRDGDKADNKKKSIRVASRQVLRNLHAHIRVRDLENQARAKPSGQLDFKLIIFDFQRPSRKKRINMRPVMFQSPINYLYADDLKLLKVSFKTIDKALNVKTHVANTNEQILSIFREYVKDGYQFFFYIFDIQFPCQREGLVALQLIRRLEAEFKFKPGFAVALEANLEKMQRFEQSDYQNGFNYVICKAMNHDKLKDIIVRANQWNSRILLADL